LRLNKKAAIEPVHAPVTGKGIATNNIKPIDLYRSTTALLLFVCLKSQSKKRLNSDILLRNLESGSKNRRIGIIVVIFPNIDIGTTIDHFR